MLDEDPVVFDIFSQILMNFIWQYKLTEFSYVIWALFLLPNSLCLKRQKTKIWKRKAHR